MTGFATDPRNLSLDQIEQLALAAVPERCGAEESRQTVNLRSETPDNSAPRPPEPLDIQRGRREYYRQLQMWESTEFGSTFRHQDSSEVESYAHWAPTALEAQEQLEVALPGMSVRQATRKALADVLEQRALPEARQQQQTIKYVLDVVERLRRARHTFTWGYSLAKGKTIVLWDEKAGLSRLCPDDAREETQRLCRRVLGPLEAAQEDGCALHYLVLTSPNAAPGGLRKEMVSICKRFRRLIL
jgi:hypothetical protein